MHTWIYKSSKREFTYIYLQSENNFDVLPDTVKPYLGDLICVMSLNLNQINKLANADINQVKADLHNQGFYIQLAPEENKINELTAN